MRLVPTTSYDIRAGYPASVPSSGWEAVIRWWDGVELWLTQQWLPLQVALLMVVLLPTCWWVALLIDRGVDVTSEWLRRRTRAEDAEDAP